MKHSRKGGKFLPRERLFFVEPVLGRWGPTGEFGFVKPQSSFPLGRFYRIRAVNQVAANGDQW